MSVLCNMLSGGYSIARRNNWREQLMYWLGRKLAEHPRVHLGKNVLIHPSAQIHPRQGEIFIGDNSVINSGSCIQGNVRIGTNCSINRNGNIVGYGSKENPDGQITIGDNVRIAANCMMIAANHNFADLETPIAGQGLTNGPITIGDDVWLGGYVKIVANCSVADHSVVGMGSVVTKDIPAYSIAVGVPAKVVKSRKD